MIGSINKMWLIPTKKQIKEELKKIAGAFRKRDKRIDKQGDSLNSLKSQVESNKVQIAELRGAMSVLMGKSQRSQSQQVPISIKKSQGNIETKVINRIRRGKKAVTMTKIKELAPTMSVIEMYDKLVLGEGLCSKASFYRYVAGLKSQSQLVSETNEIK